MQEVVSRDTVVELERDDDLLTDVRGDVAIELITQEHVRIVRGLDTAVHRKEILRRDLLLVGTGLSISAVSLADDDILVGSTGDSSAIFLIGLSPVVELTRPECIHILEVGETFTDTGRIDIDDTILNEGSEDSVLHGRALVVVVARSAVRTSLVAKTSLLIELVDTEGVLVLVDGDRLTVTVVGLEGTVHGDDSILELILGSDLVDLVPLEVQEVGEELAVLDGDILNLEGGVVSESLEHEFLVSDFLASCIETVGNLDLEGLLVRGKTGKVREFDLELREASLVDVDRPDHTDIVRISLLNLVIAVVVDQSVTEINRLAINLDNTVLVPIPSPNGIGGNSDLAEFLGDGHITLIGEFAHLGLEDVGSGNLVADLEHTVSNIRVKIHVNLDIGAGGDFIVVLLLVSVVVDPNDILFRRELDVILGNNDTGLDGVLVAHRTLTIDHVTGDSLVEDDLGIRGIVRELEMSLILGEFAEGTIVQLLEGVGRDIDNVGDARIEDVVGGSHLVVFLAGRIARNVDVLGDEAQGSGESGTGQISLEILFLDNRINIFTVSPEIRDIKSEDVGDVTEDSVELNRNSGSGERSGSDVHRENREGHETVLVDVRILLGSDDLEGAGRIL